ncbi:MAG: GFA family protein [Pseudomonadales bacterium]
MRGSCACGSITYKIIGNLRGPLTYCHCWRCRKHSGSSFGTTARIDQKALAFETGEELLSYWESSPGVNRYFASCCGSPIYKTDQSTPGELGFRLGTLDEDPGLKVAQHYMTVSKAPWVDIDDGLPQIAGPDAPFGKQP